MSNVATHWETRHGKLLLALSLDSKEVGRRIAEARDKKGWTQLAFASEAHVSPSSIARWEAGKLPPVRELMRIADVLEIDVETLVETPTPIEEDLRAELEGVRRGLDDVREVKKATERIEGMLRELLGRPPTDAAQA